MFDLDRRTGAKNKFHKNSSIFLCDLKANISNAQSFHRANGRLELIFDFIKSEAKNLQHFCIKKTQQEKRLSLEISLLIYGHVDADAAVQWKPIIPNDSH